MKAFGDYPNPNFHQIELDLKRTFPEESTFYQQPHIMAFIRNVLGTYAKRNPLIGYCQGMNFVLARMLKVVTDEEQAFWTFTHLVENILPIDYYTQLIGI
jgi:hypothetical protein